MEVRQELCAIFRKLEQRYQNRPVHDEIEAILVDHRVNIETIKKEMIAEEEAISRPIIVPAATASSAVTSATTTSVSTPHEVRHISNLKLDLQKFCGKLTEWITFWAHFQSCMDKKKTLSVRE